MKLKAERIESDICKPFLNDFKRRHFFGNEKHALSVKQRIGYHIGDSLRFSRSRRAVQDKAPARSGGGNGAKL